MAKRKKDEEYRTFQQEWTDEFAFVERAGSPVCLICNDKIASMKRSNIKRHFDTRHASFASKYPAGDSRKKACQELLCKVQASQQQLRVWTQQGDLNSASFVGALAIVITDNALCDMSNIPASFFCECPKAGILSTSGGKNASFQSCAGKRRSQTAGLMSCIASSQYLPMMISCKRDKEEEKYCRDWEKEKDLKDWVRPVVGDERMAACRACECEMKANYAVLQQHMVTTKHQRCATPGCATALDTAGPSISNNPNNTLMETKGLCSSACSQKTKEEETDTASVHNGLGNATESFRFSAEPTLEDIRRVQIAFTAERGWGKYHQPRNLLLALVGEVGELAELFQWREDAPEGLPGWTASEREALSDELSDVLIYLVALANKCRVDLPTAALQKIEKNRLKYPVEQVYGSSKKYTEYQKE